MKIDHKLQPYQQRVVDERGALDEKIFAINNFYTTETYNMLSKREKALLRNQQKVMVQYSEILRERIATFIE